jgi:BCD family chlorophyll transporter-like MFS transporter
MTIRETTTFTQTWGGGVLGGMLIMGLLSSIFPIGKKVIALIGGVGTAFGLGLLAVCALTEQRSLLNPAIVLMGFSTGLYNVGALSLMMDMTVEGATGLYMGMWGMAQAFGTATANILAGALHTVLIEAQVLGQTLGYGVIFGLEAVLMVVGIALLSGVSVEAFRGLTRTDLTRAMEAGAVA